MQLQKLGFYLWVLFAVSTVARAQTSSCNLTITGKVLDDHDQSPLAYAEVYIEGTQIGAVADEDGVYRLKGVCPGKYTIVAEHIGCEPVSRKVNLKESLQEFNFYPEHHTEFLEEAVIVKEQSRESAEAKRRLSKVELEAARGKDLAESLEQISGVNTLKTGNTISKPVIHGLFGNRIVTLNNGIRQEDQQWGLEHSPNIDPFLMQNISVVKGAAAVQYGAGASGGVVVLEPAALPYGEKLSGEVYLIGQSNGRGGSASGRVQQGLGERWAYRAQVSGKRLGDLSAPEYNLTNTGVAEFNGSGALGYKGDKLSLNAFYSYFSSELGVLKASHIGNVTDLNRALDTDKPLIIEPFSYEINNPRQELSHQLAKLESRYRVSEKSFLQLKYGFQQNRRQEFDIRIGELNDDPANDLRLTTNTLDLLWEVQHSPKLFAKYGISGMDQQNSNLEGTGTRPILPNYNKSEIGVFAFEKWKWQNWILEGGLRYDYSYTLAQKRDRSNNVVRYPFRFSNLGASVGATRIFSDHWQWSSLLSYAYRSPHVNELLSEGLHHGSAVIEEGDVNLLPEKSLNWSNTLSVKYARRFKAELTAYLNPFDGYIYLRPTSELRLTVRGAFPVFKYTQSDALLAGIDLDGEVYPFKDLTYRFSGSYIYGWNQTEDDYLVLMPPAQWRHSLRYNLPFKGSFTNWFMQVGHKLVAPQSHFPEIKNVPDPPAGFQLFSAAAGTETKLFGNPVELSVSAENLFNRTYRNYLNRQRYYADELGFNLFVKLKFQF